MTTAIAERKTVFLSFLEKAFSVTAFLYYSGAFIQQFEKRAHMVAAPGHQDPLAMAVSYPIYLITLYLASRRAGDIFELLKKEKFVALMIFLAALSVLWSDIPMLTLRHTIGFICLTLFGVYLALNYSEGKRLGLFAFAFGTVGAASFIFVKFLPSYGVDNGAAVMSHAGAWQGIYEQKNNFGEVMALSALVFALLPARDLKRKTVKWAFLVFSLAALLFSRSETSIAAILIIALLLPLIRSIRAPKLLRGFTYCFYMGGATASAMWLSGGKIGTLLAAMGRDSTFSGRTELWSIIMEFIRKRPLLGYGYSAFWAGNVDYVQHEAGWLVLQSHNGFLDLMLGLGFLGLLIFLAGFLQAVWNSVARIRSGTGSLAFWPLFFLIVMLFSNFFESPVLDNNSIIWLLYVCTAISLYVPGKADDPPQVLP